MKYISVVVLLVLMTWSWSVATAARANVLARHQNIEEGVQESVRAFIQSKYPTTTNFFCPQLFTEVVHADSVLLARFRCKVVGQAGDDDTSEQVFEGFLRLESKDGFETWDETGGEIRAKEIRFLNGVKITPEKK
jgi:hypothetical protein